MNIYDVGFLVEPTMLILSQTFWNQILNSVLVIQTGWQIWWVISDIDLKAIEVKEESSFLNLQ